MKIPALRLVEPLSDYASFPEILPLGKESLVIADRESVVGALQLFLLWPEFSSSLVRIGKSCEKVQISFDETLSEIDVLFLKVSPKVFALFAQGLDIQPSILFEVFGLTYEFSPSNIQLNDNAGPDEPNIAIGVPDSLKRIGVRRSRRILLKKIVAASLLQDERRENGYLSEVGARGFKFLVQKTQGFEIGSRIRVAIDGIEFDLTLDQVRDEHVIASPIVSEPQNFGKFFDRYVHYAYPDLRSRLDFASDPIPAIADQTGQAKKFATNEASENWKSNIAAAYDATKDAQHEFTADYVAVEGSKPVGASSLAKAFIDDRKNPIWAFHGLSIVQDQKFLEQTAAIYSWRSDYLISRNEPAKIVGWFDGRGRWLEKVYVKFQRLTPEQTSLWPIVLRRFVRVSELEPIASSPKAWNTQVYHAGRFLRRLYSGNGMSIGLGVPYLNISGGLDKAFHTSQSANSDELKTVVRNAMPARFSYASPSLSDDPVFEGYEGTVLEVVSRQFISQTSALGHFQSSIEHSMAVTRRKYAA